MNTSDEAIKAGADALFSAMKPYDAELPTYVTAGGVQAVALNGRFDLAAIARTVLEAAAPHLMAQAWDDALQYVYEESYITRPQLEALQSSNPYRTTK